MDRLGKFAKAIKPQKDGDLVDRLNYYYTTLILAACTIFVSGWSFVGKPLQCWFPPYFKGWWMEYALDYCYVQNTYFLPFYAHPKPNYWEITQKHAIEIPKNITLREERLIGYYQWVPFVLAIEMILFYLPVMIWRGLYSHSGIRVGTICNTASNADNMTPDKRKKNIESIAKFLDYSILTSDKLGKRFLSGRFIMVLFIVTKLLFVINAFAQFFMLEGFLGLDASWWGVTVLKNLIQNREWPETGHFPRVTLCDFEVRELGNLHRHSVQCVLIINMFNEKIFVFLWWWFLIVGTLSFVSLLYWSVTLMVQRLSESMVLNYLERVDKQVREDRVHIRPLVRRFLQRSLRGDGIFLLRLTAANSGDVVALELVEALWKNFKKREAESSPNTSVSQTPTLKMPSGKSPTAPPLRGQYPSPPYPIAPQLEYDEYAEGIRDKRF